MGAAHSRKRHRCTSTRSEKFKFGSNNLPSTEGYFLLSFKGDKIRVVNCKISELNLLSVIIKRHCRILKEGWDRHMTYSFRLSPGGRHRMIQLVADTLLSLYQNAWQPMRPLDVGMKMKGRALAGPQTTICLRRRVEENLSDQYGSRFSMLSSAGSSRDMENSCICLETYGSNYLGFHEASNTILHDIVESIQKEYHLGVSGVSMGVASVISDYTRNMPPTLPGHPDLIKEKYIQLGGDPWSSDDLITRETLQMSIIACLTKDGYKLSLDIPMDTASRVFFFIRDTESCSTEVLIPDMSKLEVGDCSRPTVVRSKSSFFRKHHGRIGTTRKHTRGSFRKKAVTREMRAHSVMTYKPRLSELAWWQQASTDMSSDQEDDGPDYDL